MVTVLLFIADLDSLDVQSYSSFARTLSEKTGMYLVAFIAVAALQAAGVYGWNSFTNRFSEMESANAMQAADGACLLSGAHEVCRAAKFENGNVFDYLHICPQDGE